MHLLKRAALAAAVMLVTCAAPAAASPMTPFSLTDGGLTVQFLSEPNPNGFVVSSDVAFVLLQGNTLIELFDNGNELGILLSYPDPAVALDFALSITVPGNLDWFTYNGATLVDSGSVTGTPQVPGDFAEGNLLIAGAPFDLLVLSTGDAPAFAIDNLVVFDSAEIVHSFNFDAPEPLSLAVFGMGLLGAGALHRRRKPL